MPRRLTSLIAIILAITLLLPIAAPPPAEGTIPVIDPANLLQNIFTALQTYYAIAQRVSNLRSQYEQVAHQIQNLRNLVDPDTRQIATLLYYLKVILEQTDGLVYSMESLDREFRRLFAGYTPAEDLQGEYRERVHRVLETSRAALLATQRLSRNSVPSQQSVGAMKEQLLEAEGNLEAAHAQGLLVAFAAEETSKLGEQMALLVNLIAVDQAHRVNTRATETATFEAWLSKADIPLRPYAAHTPIPLLP